ncbi:MAG: response regulator, partial [Pseudomonadota bacterium]|nr:response regulator [Pseudomonadota bacterium]
MTVSVLVVDDSGFFRKRLTEILTSSGQIKVVGAATNGREGVELAEKLRPDVITMDYEMPVMDGITAVREILRKRPIPVLMFSSLTYEGARVTLDALEAGAVDFLPKNFEEIARDNSQLQRILIDRILDVARSRPGNKAAPAAPDTSTPAARQPGPTVRPRTPPVERPRPGLRERPLTSSSAGEAEAVRRPARRGASKHYAVVGIGTSTGGPVALQRVLTALPASFPAPLVLVQHMPASFTPAFAERLNKLCQIEVRQAED